MGIEVKLNRFVGPRLLSLPAFGIWALLLKLVSFVRCYEKRKKNRQRQRPRLVPVGEEEEVVPVDVEDLAAGEAEDLRNQSKW